MVRRCLPGSNLGWRAHCSHLNQVCIKLNSKPSYVRLPEGRKEKHEDYGPYSIEEWHKRHKVFAE